MNWYKTIKIAQMNINSMINAIYQRLMQAELSQADGESAVDDLFEQGLDPSILEPAIQGAVSLIVGDVGDETMLTPAQQSVLATIRGQIIAPPQQELEPEPINTPNDGPIGEELVAKKENPPHLKIRGICDHYY